MTIKHFQFLLSCLFRPFVFKIFFLVFLCGFPNVIFALEEKILCFKDHCLSVEIAADQQARTQGLMDRTFLPENSGMLFVFPQEDVRSFWMKNTLIPLDMIWLDDSLTIIDIMLNSQPCQQEPCPVYSSLKQAQYVLEVNAGFVQTHGLELGDQAVFKKLEP